jgi:hypothetical protein
MKAGVTCNGTFFIFEQYLENFRVNITPLESAFQGSVYQCPALQAVVLQISDLKQVTIF